MIGRLIGELIERDPGQLLIDVGGVGYEVEIPLSTYSQVMEVTGAVTLYTHFVVRDDAQLLFGFSTKQERTLFRALIKVNAVGPRMALGILSGLNAEAFATAIRNNDIKLLTALPGVGKKTAERLVIEMRDKVDAFGVPGEAIAGTINVDVVSDAESALIALGYKPAEASRALTLVESKPEDVESLIRLALKHLMRH